jgi:hypothetical protein
MRVDEDLARNDGTGPEVRRLLVEAADPQYSLVSELRYPDGRRLLLSTVGNAWFFVHSQVLAYEFLNYATSGLFIGAETLAFKSATECGVLLPNQALEKTRCLFSCDGRFRTGT